ncbi:MAG: class I SAM-dependent methyltransferase [Magnetococcales bacterium]|nr:class I SAM-dependent methyltransferase [Magnetococcales bacterium]
MTMPSILPRLYAIYQQAGYTPMTGYSPHLINDCMSVQFTTFLHEGDIRGDFGISLQEVQFMERLNDYLQPKNILVIGNAYGWSTIALALTFPQARVIGVDINSRGVDLTNQLIRHNKLQGIALSGRSPADMAPIIKEQLAGTIDLALIDAEHTIEAMKADFFEIQPFLSEDSLCFFHDLIGHNLVPGFLEIIKQSRKNGLILTRTTSGMGLLFRTINRPLADYLNCFADQSHSYALYHGLINHYLAANSEHRSPCDKTCPGFDLTG